MAVTVFVNQMHNACLHRENHLDAYTVNNQFLQCNDAYIMFVVATISRVQLAQKVHGNKQSLLPRTDWKTQDS